jgi:hypothetical protein
MRRTWGSRVFAVFMAFWLAFSLTEPALLHACPVHSGGSVAPESGHAAHGANASHHQQPTDGGTTHQCTCLGSCSSASPIGLKSPTLALVDLTTVATRDSGLPDHVYVPVAAEHVLPYQNGPPAAA